MSSTTMLSRFSSRTVLALLVFLIFTLAVPTESYRRGWTNALVNRQSLCNSKPHIIAELLRGGASDDESSDDESSDDEEEADEQEDEEEEDVAESEAGEEEEEEDEYDAEEYDVEEEESSASIQKKSEEYVDPYFLSPTMSIYTTLGSMVIASKMDMYNPTVVRVLRFAFIASIILQQVFILYFRVMASKNNDRTPLTIQNQISSMLQSQLDQAPGANDMVKNLASSFLQSTSTVMEYDIKQANNMQGGMLFTLALMWFLHFRLGQVQPLLMQVATGILNLVYNPLFQVYVMGRNLERPFKTPVSPAQKMADAAAASDVTEEVTVAAEKAEEDDEKKEENDEDEEKEDGEDDGEDAEESNDESEEGDAEGDEEAEEDANE